MDIIDIAIAKSKATTSDLSNISLAVSNYLDERGIQSEINNIIVDIDNLKLTHKQSMALIDLLN